MSDQTKLSKRIVEAFARRHTGEQWEKTIAALLHKLELPKEKHAAAVARYRALGEHIARKLSINATDVHVLPQGSMATRTTVAGYGPQKFDLDVVVKLCAAKYAHLTDSTRFFADFGEALKGAGAGSGAPAPMNRCWRLQYPGEPFYFDVTPAIPHSLEITGTDLRVRDKFKVWAPSNPQDLIAWFEGIASLQFAFQRQISLDEAVAKSQVDPVPDAPVALHDILRRTVQLIKVHRDAYYRGQPDAIREGMPISIILVTLATKAYEQMVRYENLSFGSAIEVALEIVDRLPQYIDRSHGHPTVCNPKFQHENFADKWTTDGGMREKQFKIWHNRLVTDLEALFSDDYSRADEAKINGIFGQVGVDAWKAAMPRPSGVFGGLLQNAAAGNPSRPTSTGSRNTAG